MTQNEIIIVSNMVGSCAGVTIFVLSAILGAILETKINWFKW